MWQFQKSADDMGLAARRILAAMRHTARSDFLETRHTCGALPPSLSPRCRIVRGSRCTLRLFLIELKLGNVEATSFSLEPTYLTAVLGMDHRHAYVECDAMDLITYATN